VTLVDTKGKGVQLITPAGPVVEGEEYELDVLIYATGFDFCKVGTFNSITGVAGAKLGDKWENGIRTFLGVHTAGFPNLFIMGGPQAFGAAFNFMSLLEQQGRHVAAVVKHMRSEGLNTVDARPDAEEDYVNFCIRSAEKAPFNQCSSYYNQEGTAKPQDLPYSASSSRYYSQLAEAQQGLAADPSVSPYLFSR
jgi:cation diffusion facilitator CzcD-associated flavoprotein CzcO